MIDFKQIKTLLIDDSGKVRREAALGLSIVFLFLLFSVIYMVNSYADRMTYEAIYDKQMSLKADFAANKSSGKKLPMAQDDELPGIVLLNVGDEDTHDIDAGKIHNIFLVIFEKRATYGRVNIVGLQKKTIVQKGEGDNLVTIQDTFDRENPQPMYDAIEKATDYKVSGFIVYNNDTVKDFVDQTSLLNVNVLHNESYNIDDIPLLNEWLDQNASGSGVTDIKHIDSHGVQPFNSTEMLAYVNLYYDKWNCINNDWRNLYFLYYAIRDLKYNSIDNMVEIGKILFKGETDLDEEQCIAIGAAIRAFRVSRLNRWPDKEKSLVFNGQIYSIPENLIASSKVLHIEKHEEKEYKPSRKMRAYRRQLNAIKQYTEMYPYMPEASGF